MRSTRSMASLTAIAVVALLAAGCAGTAGSAKPLASVVKPETLTRYTKLALVTSAQSDAAKMTEADRQRISALVIRKVKERAPNRYADLVATSTDPDTLHVNIAFTRYDEGNAFARFMLAGLGQIHINAGVTLEDRSAQSIVGRFEVTKTFAWGGIYGAATGMKDVEDGFAEAVANVVLGQPSE